LPALPILPSKAERHLLLFHISTKLLVTSVHSSLDKEALRVINALKPWKPGMQRGKPVKVSYTVPVSFQQNNKIEVDDLDASPVKD